MSELEWKTRRDRIDTRLRALGWEISRFAPGLTTSGLNHHAITEFETANGTADYALVVDGQALGNIEAKKPCMGPRLHPMAHGALEHSESLTFEPGGRR